ncbi:gliding motility protein GldN [Myroides ceti]|uniref:Gliding motility protein GldN n=1 Tax=Paenimyroides ceti TaxID=395087 RepID=A0ABT8CUY7_9FLAO|nr:gliding motility protein GldN [Paenimyroides ceti]MDN3708298.1 gliding motility protein GldN [Paenimyroides ceti]
MKLKNIIALALTSFVSLTSMAQTNLFNARTANEIGEKTLEDIISEAEGPMPYEYVNDRDVIFQKTVWETIPLDERANLIYYFPTKDQQDRKSLFSILKEGVMKKEIQEVYDFDDFSRKISTEELKKKFSRIDTTDVGKELLSYGEKKIPDEYIIETELTPADVVEYRIKGAWYFDRNQGELKYRLLGIAPVVVDINTKGSEQESFIELFWVFFPAARETFFKNYAYNEKNSRMKSNFDYLFNARKFSATIYKTDNIYGDEDISSYVGENAMFQLLESERIKEHIRDFEDDLWNY